MKHLWDIQDQKCCVFLKHPVSIVFFTHYPTPMSTLHIFPSSLTSSPHFPYLPLTHISSIFFPFFPQKLTPIFSSPSPFSLFTLLRGVKLKFSAHKKWSKHFKYNYFSGRIIYEWFDHCKQQLHCDIVGRNSGLFNKIAGN